METIITFFEGVINTQIFLLSLSIMAFFAAQFICQRLKLIFLHPILLASLLVIAVLKLTGISFERYYEANEVINFILSISVVCLSYLMHKNVAHIKEHKVSILISTFVGSLVGVLSICGVAYLLGYEDGIIFSIQPKSVTTAIAISLSENQGGIPALTSLAVVVTGISGSVFGPWLLDKCGIRDSVARGAALGSASHAVGTARALELGALEGAIGGSCICLMGLFTSILIPIINAILY